MSFEPGALPPEGFIPLCIPKISGNEWKYIKACLDSGWVSSVGGYVDRFEQMVAEYVNANYAVATMNGTSALHVALLVTGIQPNDEILVSTLSFIAPANAIRYVGAWPVFIDAEPNYWQIDPQKAMDFLRKECVWRNDTLYNKVTNRRVSGILPVHILGHPVDMDPILEIARKYNLVVIEDATESLGAKYNGRMVGHLGDIACFSFNGNKIITTGGGGMLVTDNEDWARRAKYLTTQAKDDAVEYIHQEIGYNYRLTNIQAAMGCAQLELLDNFIANKREIAATYTTALADVTGITPMPEADWAYSIFWMYTVLVNEKVYGIDSRAVLQQLASKGIQTRPLWLPLHRNQAHANSQAYYCDVAEQLNQNALSLPCSVGLKDGQLNSVIQNLKDFFNSGVSLESY